MSHVENKLDTIFDNVAGEHSHFSILAVSVIPNSEEKTIIILTHFDFRISPSHRQSVI